MPPRITIPFVGTHAQASDMQVNAQETLNMITSVRGTGAKAPVILESAPGLVEIGPIGNGAVRSPNFIQWRHPTDGTTDTYAVFGRQLVRITQATGVSVIGTLQDVASTVRMARGRTHIMMVDGVAGYTYDGTTFGQIADPDFPDAGSSPPASPTHVVYQDGYFIVNDAFSDNFHISAIEDPDNWNALDFEAAAVAPDRSLAMANTESELWILGDETAQAYYNSGNAIFPFAIILSATQEVGIAAPQSVAESDAGIFFLATTPEGGLFVYQIRGQSGRIVSNESIDEQLATSGDTTAATGFIYQQEGNSFYVLHLNPESPTLIYNIRAQVWETRSLIDGSGWRIGGAGIFNGQNIGGSRLAARYYRLDTSNYTDVGGDFVRRRVTQVFHRHNHLMDWWELVVDVQSGVGNQVDPGSNPQLRLRYSDDGGATWSQTLSEPLGKIGERQRRAVYRNLGSSRQRVFELEMSDPVELTIIAAYAVVQVLGD